MAEDVQMQLAEQFGAIARALLAEQSPEATLVRIVQLAVETIRDCQHAGISVSEGKTVTSSVSSDEVPAVLERIQTETGEGPCVDAIKERDVFQTGNLAEEERWPSFARRAAAESGSRSVLSFRLFANKDTMGALNLYSTRLDAFDAHDLAVGAVYATHAAVAWNNSELVANLRAGMETRQMIGAATGLLMARHNMSEEEAFDVLRRASQRLNVKLRLLAERIVHPEESEADLEQ